MALAPNASFGLNQPRDIFSLVCLGSFSGPPPITRQARNTSGHPKQMPGPPLHTPLHELLHRVTELLTLSLKKHPATLERLHITNYFSGELTI